MTAFDQDVNKTFTDVSADNLKLRMRLILEEFIEFVEACTDSGSPKVIATIACLKAADLGIEDMSSEDMQLDHIEAADALTDIEYVTLGSGHSIGVNLDACFEEVHGSNMSKAGADGKPIFREDGKIEKGPNYYRPNLGKVLKEHGCYGTSSEESTL